MIFNFLKYVTPVWYFHLRPKQDYSYFPDAEELNRGDFFIPYDESYQSIDARERDRAWRAHKKGFINTGPGQGIDVWVETQLPIADEYRFVRKYFHPAWVYFILFVRLLSFHNPFREINAVLKTRKVQQVDLSAEVYTHAGYKSFDSQLLKKQPFISVIIPTLNRYEYLKEVFKDLEKQVYTNFEVIVVDQTPEFNEEFYKGWDFNLRYWYQEEKALWKARNEAIKAAKGEYILMSEDDIRIPKDFIENHLKCLDYFNASVSCGVFFPQGSTIPKQRNYFQYSSQFATGNALLPKSIFKEVGLFDRQFEKQRMGDGEFGLRVYLSGKLMVSNPLAYCVDVKAPVGGLRQMGSWDAWRSKNVLAPRPIPSVLYLVRKYFGSGSAGRFVLTQLPVSILPYKFKGTKVGVLLSLLIFIFLWPLAIFQVTRSWCRASKMLYQGALIDRL